MRHFIAVVLSLVLIPGLYAQTVIRTNVLFDFGKYDLRDGAKKSLIDLKEKIHFCAPLIYP